MSSCRLPRSLIHSLQELKNQTELEVRKGNFTLKTGLEFQYFESNMQKEDHS